MKDTENVIALWNECGLTRPWNDPNKDIIRKLGTQRDLFLVMELGGEIIGAVMAGYDGHRGSVNYLAISPNYQRNGYARQLMDKIEEELIKLGCPKINLLIRSSNIAVKDFYNEIGYSSEDVVCFGKRLIVDN